MDFWIMERNYNFSWWRHQGFISLPLSSLVITGSNPSVMTQFMDSWEAETGRASCINNIYFKIRQIIGLLITRARHHDNQVYNVQVVLQLRTVNLNRYTPREIRLVKYIGNGLVLDFGALIGLERTTVEDEAWYCVRSMRTRGLEDEASLSVSLICCMQIQSSTKLFNGSSLENPTRAMVRPCFGRIKGAWLTWLTCITSAPDTITCY